MTKMATSNYYDTLNLCYPEIAICIDRIDRTNPGTRNFYIPILTPDLDTTSLKKKTEIVRNSSSVIANQDAVQVDNVEIQNYIPITIPKELCAFVGGDFIIKNVENMTVEENGTITISGSTSYNGGLSHNHATLEGTGRLTLEGEQTLYKGILNIVPTDEYRYIAPGSKWLVMFIGGDINKPQIIAPYTEPAV